MPPVNDAWFLPDGVDELLPEQSERLEELRNKLLNVVRSHGYQLVSPPFIEFVDTLLTGAGQEFSLETFKLTDQLTGRMMGVRADMTPQVARIDAYRLNDSRPNRLCYLGTVLRALPEGFSGTRSPLQFGAEIYGHQGVHSDAEAIALMHTVLTTAGINNLYLDIGHVGIFRGLTQQAGLKQTAEEKLFGLMQRKALPEISAYLDSLSLSHNLKSMLLALSRLNGDESTLLRAKRELEQACETVQDALSYLQKIAGELKYRCPECSIHFDLAELRGYRYHTGVVFAAFVPGRGHEVARGGRYDNIASPLGMARPATGFSTDLKSLVSLVEADTPPTKTARRILAPQSKDTALWECISSLRAAGDIVILELPGQMNSQKPMNEMGCQYKLVHKNKQWIVVEA
ncbi:MAG: ATP phosphoribosyltransferase regulatory subunit [Gammaproteobacteria bacterium]|nr:ATP phosphoribosyltransferase regulatory subunit [Gammaproteobacteria bacterium]